MFVRGWESPEDRHGDRTIANSKTPGNEALVTLSAMFTPHPIYFCVEIEGFVVQHKR